MAQAAHRARRSNTFQACASISFSCSTISYNLRTTCPPRTACRHPGFLCELAQNTLDQQYHGDNSSHPPPQYPALAGASPVGHPAPSEGRMAIQNLSSGSFRRSVTTNGEAAVAAGTVLYERRADSWDDALVLASPLSNRATAHYGIAMLIFLSRFASRWWAPYSVIYHILWIANAQRPLGPSWKRRRQKKR